MNTYKCCIYKYRRESVLYKMPYLLGNKSFKTKKQITKYFQDLHNIHDEHYMLVGEHKDVMMDLIKWHPLYDEWNVCSDEAIDFKLGIDEWGSKHYKVLNILGGWDTYSYRKCIQASSKEINQKKNMQNAARVSIKDQIFDCKMNAKGGTQHIGGIQYIGLNCIVKNLYKCSICTMLHTEVEIDHHFDIITFQKLLENFMVSQNKQYKDYNLISKEYGHTFNDIDEVSWQEYHKEHAVLRCLCVNCHRKKISKKINI